MSDKNKFSQKSDPDSYLKKKSSRGKKTVKTNENNFDLNKLKEKFISELKSSTEQSQGNIKLENDKDDNHSEQNILIYEKAYKQYISQGFSSNFLIFVSRLINDSETLPAEIRSNFTVHDIVIDVVKVLMMNELELVYLSLYLDKLGWYTEGFNFMENVMMTGLSVKMYLTTNYIPIIDHLEKTLKITITFNRWLKTKRNYYLAMNIAPRELNERYKLFVRPVNTYCKNNYIDYNFCVDEILRMSMPYSANKENDKLKSVKVENNNTFENETDLKFSDYKVKALQKDLTVENKIIINQPNISNKSIYQMVNDYENANSIIFKDNLDFTVGEVINNNQKNIFIPPLNKKDSLPNFEWCRDGNTFYRDNSNVTINENITFSRYGSQILNSDDPFGVSIFKTVSGNNNLNNEHLIKNPNYLNGNNNNNVQYSVSQTSNNINNRDHDRNTVAISFGNHNLFPCDEHNERLLQDPKRPKVSHPLKLLINEEENTNLYKKNIEKKNLDKNS